MEEKYSVKMAELMKESETDIKINFLRLEEELPHNQNLIGKWMTYQQVYQTKYQFLELDHKIVMAEKTKYYTGKLSEDEILAKGWEIEGTKILKADLHVWTDSDLDIVKSKKNLSNIGIFIFCTLQAEIPGFHRRHQPMTVLCQDASISFQW